MVSNTETDTGIDQDKQTRTGTCSHREGGDRNSTYMQAETNELLQTLGAITDWGEGLTHLEMLGCSSMSKKDIFRFREKVRERARTCMFACKYTHAWSDCVPLFRADNLRSRCEELYDFSREPYACKDCPYLCGYVETSPPFS